MDVAVSKSRGMDATSFVVAGTKMLLTEHLENIRFGIRSKDKTSCRMIRKIPYIIFIIRFLTIKKYHTIFVSTLTYYQNYERMKSKF